MENFVRTILPNRMTVICEQRKSPVVTLIIASKFASAYEKESKSGLAHFFEHMIFKGTRKRSQKEITGSIENIGGEIDASTSSQLTKFYVKVPKKHFELGIDVLSDMLLNPTVPKKEIEKERKVILEEIKRKHDTPLMGIHDKLRSLLYKKPFGLPRIGTVQTVSKLDRKDLLSAHSFYTPNNLIVAAVGGVSPNDVIKLTNEKFYKKRITKLPKYKVGKIAKTDIEKRKGIDQAHLSFGFHVPSLAENGRHAAEALNNILGEGMSSRIFQEIREKKGLAYTAQSFIIQGRDYGFIEIYIGTSKDKVKQVKEIVLKEIKKLQKISKKELEEAKESLIGRYALTTEDSLNTTQELLSEEMAGNAEEFYNYSKHISEIKLEDVKKVAKVKNYALAAIVPE